MAELVQLTPTLGINVALIASWQDVPSPTSPFMIVTYAACATGIHGDLKPMTEEYYGAAREALLHYFASHAYSIAFPPALPLTTEGV
jgi:hypothetical protein